MVLSPSPVSAILGIMSGWDVLLDGFMGNDKRLVSAGNEYLTRLRIEPCFLGDTGVCRND